MWSCVARKNPVPQRDIEIGARLLEMREDALVTRSTLAKEVAIAREALISYETGTVPLQFWPAVRICKVLDINQTYLASGIGPFRPYVEFDIAAAKRHVSDRVAFSKGYDDYLASIVEHQSLVHQAIAEMKHGCESSLFELYEVVSLKWFKTVPRGSEGEFIKRLAGAAKEIIQDLQKAPPKERDVVLKEMSDFVLSGEWEKHFEWLNRR